MSVVLDASALLAWLQDEPGAERVDAILNEAVMSTVNWAEVYQKSLAHDVDTTNLREDLELLGMRIEPFTTRLGRVGNIFSLPTISMLQWWAKPKDVSREENIMSPIQTIQQHVTHFPPDEQAEVLDFVLFLEHKITLNSSGKIQAGATTSVRSVGGSLKEYAPTYIPLRDAREQAIQEYFHERFSRC